MINEYNNDGKRRELNKKVENENEKNHSLQITPL